MGRDTREAREADTGIATLRVQKGKMVGINNSNEEREALLLYGSRELPHASNARSHFTIDAEFGK